MSRGTQVISGGSITGNTATYFLFSLHHREPYVPSFESLVATTSNKLVCTYMTSGI